MKIEIEDLVFGSLALVALVIWLLLILIFDFLLIAIIFLWISMISISLLYIYFYKKNNRNIKLLRLRFLISGIPIYPMMIYYIFILIVNNELTSGQRFLPLFVLVPSLVLNGSILYIWELRKNDKSIS